jgi:bisanhydrobacterioruberin hydratase
MTLVKKNIPIFIIIVFHLVGFVGFIYNPSYFKSLSPVNLLLSMGLIVLMSQQKKWQFYLALALVGVLGFLVEVLGVKTEIIFGSYYYGHSLGSKILSVPLLIGVNWSMLLYCTAQLSRFKNSLVNAFFGAFLMVLLDFFIEQNASKFDFWYWKNNLIPLQNYFAWFIIAFLLNLLVQKQLALKRNLTAIALYFVQLVFFSSLYFFV